MRDDSRGSVAVMTAMVLPVLVGMGGLAVDASLWMTNKSAAQAAADSAGRAMIVAVNGGATASQAEQIGYDVAKANGYTTGAGGVTVAITNPSTDTYKVKISQAQSLFFSGIDLAAAPTVSAQTTVQTTSAGPACILALDPTDSASLYIKGTPAVSTNHCFVGVNSKSSTGTILQGGASLSTVLYTTVGNYSLANNSTLNATNILTGDTATPDPYSNLPTPTPGTCQTWDGYSNLTPGTYCSNININNGMVQNLSAGVYIFNGGSLSVNGNSSFSTASGAILIFMNGAYFHFNGTGALSLTAPSSGTYQGVAVYVDRAMANSNADTINGSNNMAINGAVYAPTQSISYSGVSVNTQCTQLVAWTITFAGTSNFVYSPSCPGGTSALRGSIGIS